MVRLRRHLTESRVVAARHALEAGAEQGFSLGWWNLLRHHLVRPEGEMLLVADPTQDVYGRRAWTDERTMSGAGFSGPWTELKGPHRMPSDPVPIAKSFAARYLCGDRIESEVSADIHEIIGHHATTRRRWRNLDRPDDLGDELGLEVVRLLREVDGLAPCDVVFLCEDHTSGLAAVRAIERAGLPVHHSTCRPARPDVECREQRGADQDRNVPTPVDHSFRWSHGMGS